MKKALLPLGPSGVEIDLPDRTDVYAMPAPAALSDVAGAAQAALRAPVGSRPLAALAREAVARAGARRPRATIVVSDNTRPVPYTGECGILLPILQELVTEGFAPADLLVLVATGTHRAMTRAELEAMIDPRVFALGVEVANHDCRDESSLVFLGKTSRGSDVYVNRRYVEAELKVLTGLVESHFMAGASGGRKSVCPGIIGEKSTYVFHGAAMMAHPDARDLVLDGNPCHEESLEVARLAGVDFIVNVTMDRSFRPTGIFAGDLEAAHRAAVREMERHVGIPVDGQYDVVVTHGGFVGVNHYQTAKAGVAALGAVRAGGHLVVVADNRDPVSPVGSLSYRTTLQLLKLVGPAAFTRIIGSADWTFISEQWQTQMWAKVFTRVPFANLAYFAPQLDDRHWVDLPGVDGRGFLPEARRAAPELPDAVQFVAGATAAFARGSARIAYLSDGPYGIPHPSRKGVC